MAFKLFLIFIISYFIHLPARIPILGTIRFDLLLVCLIALTIVISRKARENTGLTETDKILLALGLYIFVTIPLAEWPGSVLKNGMPNLIKAMSFYVFALFTIKTEKQLKYFMFVFIGCQTFRVLEPLYLHVTEGYWGSITAMGDWSVMDRLSGAPHDVINPNGLAFVITSVIPFYYFLGAYLPPHYKVMIFSLIPISVYALVLTASRTGFLALFVIISGILMKTKAKIFFLALVVVGAFALFTHLTADQVDRFRSITESDVRGAQTARGRIEGVIDNFRVAMDHPFLGHGLGTSAEVNFHKLGNAMPAHNLYAEIMQELGFFGLIIFLLFIKAIYSNFSRAAKNIRADSRSDQYLLHLTDGMQVWLWMNLLFSLASYGLSSYEWYLFGGLSVVIKRISCKENSITIK